MDFSIGSRARRLASMGIASNIGTLHSFYKVLDITLIKVALAFINDPCASTHGSINASSIFISPSGEWKLGGFELCSNPKDEAATLYVSVIVNTSVVFTV